MSQSARIARRALSISILGAFLSTAFAEDHYTKSKEPVFPDVQAGHALLYIARPDFTRLIPEGTFKVFVDSTPVGWLPQRAYLAVQVDPGSRIVWGPSSATQRIDFQADKIYLLVLAEQYGQNRAIVGASWESGDPASVRNFVGGQKLTYVEPNKDSLVPLREEGEKKFGKKEQQAPEVHAAALPATFEKVWYRRSQHASAWKPYDASGTLTVTNDAIEYKSDKENFTIPTKDVKSISMGRLSGLANYGDEAPWGIVRYTNAGAEETVAFCDRNTRGGTERVVLTLGSVVKPEPSPQSTVADSQLEAAQEKHAETAAQPQANVQPSSVQPSAAVSSSEELVPYVGQKGDFEIALPKGWAAYDQSLLPGAKADSRFNLTVFYLSPNPVPQEAIAARFDEMSVELMTKIDTGEVPSFFFQKFPAKKGMSCDGFTEGAEKEALKVVTSGSPFGKGATILEAPHSEQVPVAGCKGLRIKGSGQPPKENTPQTIDVYAASDGSALYLFTLRSHADYYKKNIDVFQRSMATALLTAAH